MFSLTTKSNGKKKQKKENKKNLSKVCCNFVIETTEAQIIWLFLSCLSYREFQSNYFIFVYFILVKCVSASIPKIICIKYSCGVKFKVMMEDICKTLVSLNFTCFSGCDICHISQWSVFDIQFMESLTKKMEGTVSFYVSFFWNRKQHARSLWN